MDFGGKRIGNFSFYCTNLGFDFEWEKSNWTKPYCYSNTMEAVVVAYIPNGQTVCAECFHFKHRDKRPGAVFSGNCVRKLAFPAALTSNVYRCGA
jgi:hypothetical protein